MKKRRVVETIFDLSNKTFNRRNRKMFIKHILVSILVVLFGVFILIINVHGYRQFQTEREKSRDFFNAIIMMLLGIGLLGVFFFEENRRKKDRKGLFETYPELNNELGNLLDADYIDEDLRMLIYGHHLVSTANLNIVDLEQCQALETVGTNISRTGGLAIYSIKATLYNGETKRVDIYNPPYLDTERRLEEL